MKIQNLENKEVIIDVREKDEFVAEHIEHSIHLPLSHFMEQAPGILNQLKNKKIIIMCRSGNRAKIAQGNISQLGFGSDIDATVYTGGIMAWKAAGNPVIEFKKGHLPLMRQVQLIAGLGVFTFSMLAYFVDLRFAFAAAFFGAGLTLAGATGFCGMANLLALMPWNKNQSSIQEELCMASPAGGQCNKN